MQNKTRRGVKVEQPFSYPLNILCFIYWQQTGGGESCVSARCSALRSWSHWGDISHIVTLAVWIVVWEKRFTSLCFHKKQPLAIFSNNSTSYEWGWSKILRTKTKRRLNFQNPDFGWDEKTTRLKSLIKQVLCTSRYVWILVHKTAQTFYSSLLQMWARFTGSSCSCTK